LLHLSDLELVEQFKAGDEKAFEELFYRYKPLIAKIARKYYVRGYDEEDFRQIGAEAFYKAVLRFEEQGESTFYSYILSCVRNQLVSHFRKQSLKTEYATDFKKIAVIMESREMYTVEKSDVLDEEQNTTTHAYRAELSKLMSEQIFSPFELNCLEGFVNGLSYSEIARRYDSDLKGVNNALSRVRSKILKKHES